MLAMAMTPSSSRTSMITTTTSQPPLPHGSSSNSSSSIEYPASSKPIPNQMMTIMGMYSNHHHQNRPQHALTSILRPSCDLYRRPASSSPSTSSSSRLVEREHFAVGELAYLTPSSPTTSTTTTTTWVSEMARATAPLSPNTTTKDASSSSLTAEKRTGSEDESARPPKRQRFQRRNSQTASMLQAAISNFCTSALNNSNKEGYVMVDHDHHRHHHSHEQGTPKSTDAQVCNWLPGPHEDPSLQVEPPAAEKAPTSEGDDSEVMDSPSAAAAAAANFVEKAEELVRQIQLLSRQRRKRT
jgi:hypothetical protein